MPLHHCVFSPEFAWCQAAADLVWLSLLRFLLTADAPALLRLLRSAFCLSVLPGSGKLDAEIASGISSPAIITCQAKDRTQADITRKCLLKKALLDDHKVSEFLQLIRHINSSRSTMFQHETALVAACPAWGIYDYWLCSLLLQLPLLFSSNILVLWFCCYHVKLSITCSTCTCSFTWQCTLMHALLVPLPPPLLALF